MDTLFTNKATKRCQAIVVLPVCNEEERLGACLQALHGQSVPYHAYELLLFLNNCTDESAAIAYQFQQRHPNLSLHIAQQTLPQAQANVGTARKMLMDEAWLRAGESGAILSTDGDTAVAPDWVEMNLKQLHAGSELVGGDIALAGRDLAGLPERARAQHEADREYQQAVTLLESLLDPDPHDPWPRHHHHFGASLACTTAFYRRVGGLPQVDCLEDVALVEAARRADARVRHSPAVKVVTAARMAGRARIGLASQLREWQGAPEEPLVDSAAFLKLYFSIRHQLRRVWEGQSRRSAAASAMFSVLGVSEAALDRVFERCATFGALQDALDLRATLWRQMARGQHATGRLAATRDITALTARLCAAEHLAGSVTDGTLRDYAIPGGSENSHAPDLRWPDSRQLLA